MTTNYIAAFNATTGQLIGSFAPTLNGAVQTIIPGPAANQIYVGGNFTTADGVTTHVALLNTTDGSMVSTWKPSGQNGVVQKLVVRGQHAVRGRQLHHGRRCRARRARRAEPDDRQGPALRRTCRSPATTTTA